MADPVLRVRGLLEQALRVVDADGAFQETIRAQLVSLIEAVKTEGADTPYPPAWTAVLDASPLASPAVPVLVPPQQLPLRQGWL